MSLDERVRTGLRRSADAGGLDADEIFDGVVSAHRRGDLRARVVRQATAVAVVLTLFVGVAIFVSWRNAPLRYRSVATVSAPTRARVGGVALTWGDPVHLALAAGTQRAALHQAHLAPDDSQVDFRAKSVGANQISLWATAPTRQESAVVTDRWVSVLTKLRRDSTRRQLIAALTENRRKVTRQWTTLHRQLQTLDANLARLDPKVYGSVWKYDAPLGLRPSSLGQPNSPPPVPEHGTLHELNLAFERIRLISAIEKLAPRLGAERFGALTPTPDTTTRQIGGSGPTRVDATPSAAVPATAAWFAGIALIAAAAFVFYRRRARAPLRT